jgi:two-component system, response regulator PdtaR
MLFGRRERKIRRILIVEDEPLVAFDNEHSLTDAGYEVVATVDSVEDAARCIEEQPELHLVLTDIRLSGDGDGTDVARAAAARGVPVLFVSAHSPVEPQGLCAGWLAKPYSEKALRTALNALETHLAGGKVKRIPAGLSLYERA